MRFERKLSAAITAVVLLGVACRQPPPPEALKRLENRNLFTCCNLHYEGDEFTDANYFVGTRLPAGTPVRIDEIDEDSVTFVAGEVKLRLIHRFGKDESLQQYLSKVLVPANPRATIDAYPAAVRRAIEVGKVERGMTRDQVLASLGYPPAHRTPWLQDRTWTYWYSRWQTYQVVFDESGRVADVIGRPAPTAE
ncbi:MAG: outer membrane protein assembly factor BamE domain-containing protein, partial [Candidatus Binatia bacterium]